METVLLSSKKIGDGGRTGKMPLTSSLPSRWEGGVWLWFGGDGLKTFAIYRYMGVHLNKAGTRIRVYAFAVTAAKNWRWVYVQQFRKSGRLVPEALYLVSSETIAAEN